MHWGFRLLRGYGHSARAGRAHLTLALLYMCLSSVISSSLAAPSLEFFFPGPKLLCTPQNVKENHVMKAFVLLIMSLHAQDLKRLFLEQKQKVEVLPWGSSIYISHNGPGLRGKLLPRQWFEDCEAGSSLWIQAMGWGWSSLAAREWLEGFCMYLHISSNVIHRPQCN